MRGISQFIEDYLNYTNKNPDLTEKTKENREKVLTQLREYLDNENQEIYLHEQSRARRKIEGFFEESSRSAIPPNVHAITSFFEYLSDHENYDDSDVENCKRAVMKIKKTYKDSNAVKSIERGLLDFDDREKLLIACRNSEREPLKKEVMLKLIIEAGLSRSELLALRPKDIITDSEVNPAIIRVVREWNQEKGEPEEKNSPGDNEDKTRYVAISLETRTRINQLIEKTNRNQGEFLIWENPTYRKPKRRLEEIFEVAGFDRPDLSIKDIQRNIIADLTAKEVEQHRIQDYFDSENAIDRDVIKRFSVENPTASPLAENKRIF